MLSLYFSLFSQNNDTQTSWLFSYCRTKIERVQHHNHQQQSAGKAMTDVHAVHQSYIIYIYIRVHDQYVWWFGWMSACERCVSLSQPHSTLWWPESARCILSRQLIFSWQGTNLDSFSVILIFGPIPFQNMSGKKKKRGKKKKMWGQAGC